MIERELGDLINEHRRRLDFTRVELASKCLCSEQMIYKIETAKNIPSVRLLKSIFNELGISDQFDSWRWEIETKLE